MELILGLGQLIVSLALVASILMLGNSVIEETRSTLFNFGIILAGIPVYYFWTRSRRKSDG